MLVSELIYNLQMRGLYIQAENGKLYISPKDKIPDSLRPQIKEMKDKLILFVEQWEERAAIIQFDGEMTKEEVETAAYKDVTMLNHDN